MLSLFQGCWRRWQVLLWKWRERGAGTKLNEVSESLPECRKMSEVAICRDASMLLTCLSNPVYSTAFRGTPPVRYRSLSCESVHKWPGQSKPKVLSKPKALRAKYSSKPYPQYQPGFKAPSRINSRFCSVRSRSQPLPNGKHRTVAQRSTLLDLTGSYWTAVHHPQISPSRFALLLVIYGSSNLR